jgi:hypothetical protein
MGMNGVLLHNLVRTYQAVLRSELPKAPRSTPEQAHPLNADDHVTISLVARRLHQAARSQETPAQSVSGR